MFAATIIGNLGKDGELKQVGDSSVLSLNVACRVRKGKEDTTVWVRVSYWGKAAEAVAKYCIKGKQVGVRGEVQEVRVYESNGKTGVSTELRADSLELLGGGDGAKASAPKQETHDVEPPPF